MTITVDETKQLLRRIATHLHHLQGELYDYSLQATRYSQTDSHKSHGGPSEPLDIIALDYIEETVTPVVKGWCKTHYLRVTKTGSPWRHCMDCKSKLPEDAGRSKRCGRCSNANMCTVDGCERRPAGNGLCKYHWKKNKLYGDPLGKSSYKPTKSTCTIAGCERPYHSNGYCNYHGYRAEKYGDPLAQGPGKYAGRNRMEVPSYAGMHKRIFYDKGPASKHQCVDCHGPAKEWSYKGGAPNEYWGMKHGCNLAYTTDQSYYEPRCVKCHRRKDLEIIQDNA